MTEKQPALEIARTAEETTARLRIDRPTGNLRPEPDAASSPRAFTPAARAESSARVSSGPSAPPNAPLSPPYAAPEAAPAPWFAKHKTSLGVVITCFLGALPIIALVFVRGQGSALEVPPSPTEVIATAAAPTQVGEVSARAAVLPKSALEAEPEVVATPREPRVAPAAAVQIARAKSAPALCSPPSSGPTAAVSSPAPLRTSWFHR